MRVLICLVGGQPAPNVLPLDYYHPDQVILVHTSSTTQVEEKLAKVIEEDYKIEVIKPLCKVVPYQLDNIKQTLMNFLKQNGKLDEELVFNLTGGTKPMAIAAFQLAATLSAEAFYYQSEANLDLIHPYQFDDGVVISEQSITCQANLTLDRFLKLYMGTYKKEEFKDPFERKVFDVLKELEKYDYEVFHNILLPSVSGDLEIDWILRFRNTIAVGEVKTQADKSSIDQLNSVCHPTMLGTYTKKFLISGKPAKTFSSFHPNWIELMQAYQINGMILPSYDQSEISDEDGRKLITSIRTLMEPQRRTG
jgi:hypothetical protein